MRWDVTLQPFQSSFVHSTVRYPAFVAGWATGKTLCGILKGMVLSERYSNNLGLIVRKNFTDLRDSTIQDFLNYTGIKVPSNKDVILPNGSKIMFRHMDELAGIVQNVNLGWFLIEQAEEFDSDTEFSKLRGRLRRVLTPRPEIQDKLIKRGILKQRVDDFTHLDKKARDASEDIIVQDLNEPLRQGVIIANTNGHNWVWRLWKNEERDNYHLTEASSFENIDIVPKDTIEDWRTLEKQAPAQYRRFVLNSWDETDTADQVIPYEWLMRAVNKELTHFKTPPRVVACDPAEFGDDHTVIYGFEGYKKIREEIFGKKDLMETAGRVFRMSRDIDADLIGVDDIGIGAGVRSRLTELGANVMGINSGARSSNPDEWKNIKAELWMNAQSLFRENVVSLPDDDRLIEDLATIRYHITSRGQVGIEKKTDVKKRLARSPDQGDAFVMGLWLAGKAEPKADYEDLEEQTDISQTYSVESNFV